MPHPDLESMASFLPLHPDHGWLYHCRDFNFQFPEDWANAFQLHLSSAYQSIAGDMLHHWKREIHQSDGMKGLEKTIYFLTFYFFSFPDTQLIASLTGDSKCTGSDD